MHFKIRLSFFVISCLFVITEFVINDFTIVLVNCADVGNASESAFLRLPEPILTMLWWLVRYKRHTHARILFVIGSFSL